MASDTTWLGIVQRLDLWLGHTCFYPECRQDHDRLIEAVYVVLRKHSNQTDLPPVSRTKQTSSHRMEIRPGKRLVLEPGEIVRPDEELSPSRVRELQKGTSTSPNHSGKGT